MKGGREPLSRKRRRPGRRLPAVLGLVGAGFVAAAGLVPFEAVAGERIPQAPSPPAEEGWPGLRGPSFDGTAPPAGLGAVGGPSADEGLELELAWRRPLGAGYSGIALGEGLGVTMFSDGVEDLVLAFEAATGRELWRAALGPTYRGHNGSRGGPASTPLLHGGLIYALGPRGQLLALEPATGARRWRLELSSLGIEAPFYGFATSPYPAAGAILVLGSSRQGAVHAFHPKTGARAWSAGSGRIQYQSPLPLGEGRGALVADRERVFEVDARGRALPRSWLHGLSSAEHGQPLAIGGETFVLTSLDGAVAFRREATGTRELWRTEKVKSSYARPVFSGGTLYTFSGPFLVAVDAATGELRWKSRQPKGRGLILVDSMLVILAPDGRLVLADADPQGYRERASIQALRAGDYAEPAYAGGWIVLRNQEELAGVRMVAKRALRAAAPASLERPPKGGEAGLH